MPGRSLTLCRALQLMILAARRKRKMGVSMTAQAEAVRLFWFRCRRSSQTHLLHLILPASSGPKTNDELSGAYEENCPNYGRSRLYWFPRRERVTGAWLSRK